MLLEPIAGQVYDVDQVAFEAHADAMKVPAEVIAGEQIQDQGTQR